METNIILFIAIIIFLSKVISVLFQKIQLPPILAFIIIGLVIGPTGFNLIRLDMDKHILEFFAQMGVIILLFIAGLETNLDEIRRVGKNSLFVALGGMILPFALGFGVTWFFSHDIPMAIVLGLILTATSVSVSVMTLMDIGKLKSVEGSTIINAAIIDDVIGIILLSIIFTFLGDKKAGLTDLLITVGMIVGYFAIIFVIGIFLIPFLTRFITKLKIEMLIMPFTFFLMFIFAWAAEKVEIAAITGSYFAGVFLARTEQKHAIETGVQTIGHTLFVPIFFFFIGFQTNLRLFQPSTLIFSCTFVFIAIISKLIGCGGVAKIIGFDWRRSFRIGSGMIPRGEVALIIAAIAMRHHNIIGSAEFTSIILMVIVTATLTPFLLKLGFMERKQKTIPDLKI